MITRGDIVRFYQKYKAHLQTEQRMLDGLLIAEDREVWVEKLRAKSELMRNLYIENEMMLNLYIRPLLNGESRLTDELAGELLNQILSLEKEGFRDDLACAEVAHMLERHFERSGDEKAYIRTVHYLGGYYNCLFSAEEGRISCAYFDKLRARADRYFGYDNWETRKRILLSFYNYAVVNINWQLLSDEDALRVLDEGLAFLGDPRVRALDGERYDIDGLIEELEYDTLGNRMIPADRSISPAFLSRASAELKRLHDAHIAQDPNPYAMPDEVFLNHLKCRHFNGELSRAEYILRYKAYCDHIIDSPELEAADTRTFYNSRLFQIYMFHLSNLMPMLEEEACPLEHKRELRLSYMRRFTQYVHDIPRSDNPSFVNTSILESMATYLSQVQDTSIDLRFVLEVTVYRDETSMLHSVMVKEIARLLLERVFEAAPELLVGSLGTKSVVEVLERRDEIMEFATDAAQIFDIGKTFISQIVGKQTRKLTRREQDYIRRHTQNALRIIDKAPQLAKFHDIILGHHRSYDGRFGYPEGFDITKSKDRFFIDLISICDAIDAATDGMGRAYTHAKSLEALLDEMQKGAGTRYNPDLLALIDGSDALRAELEYMTTAGRLRIYYDVYHAFIAQSDGLTAPDEPCMEGKQTPAELSNLLSMLQESSDLNVGVLSAVTRTSLLLLYVDMFGATFTVMRHNETCFLPDMNAGSYRELLEVHLREAMHPEDWPTVRKALKLSVLSREMLEHAGYCEVECRLRQPSGDDLWTRIQCYQTEEADLQPSRMVMLFSNIDQSKRRSEQLREAMETAYRSAEAANRAKSTFLSNMSHDIRTPMNVIVGMTRLAKQHVDDPKRTLSYLNKIDEASGHLLELINDVLDMAKIESGSVELSIAPTNLRTLVGRVQNLVTPEARERSHAFCVHTEGVEQAYVLADALRLEQVLINLLTNAVKYTPDGGHISLTVDEVPSQLEGRGAYRFVVQDDGIGMSEEFIAHLFTPFHREETRLLHDVQGTGLGMSIVRMLVTLMHGSIDVKSKPGEGSRFTVILPLAVDEAASPEAAYPQLEAEERWEKYDGRRALLAEDNALNREIAREILEGLGFQIDEAQDGQDALERFAACGEGTYDIIFMDVQMPRMNGYDAARAIRRLVRADAARVPIVAMTANAFAQDAAEALQSGMNGHLSKPIDMERLRECLRRWVGR